MPVPASTYAGGSPRIGLALGGGGARGIAHIHVLEAFDDLGIAPVAIAGTSIGALFGAAAAAGLSGAEIRQATLDALGTPAEVWKKVWQLRPRSLSRVLGAMPLFDPKATIDLFLPPEVPDDFSALKVPFTAVATDFYGVQEVPITSGSLRTAVAASIAIPALFCPVELDGVTLSDGGLTNPLPFDRLPTVEISVAVDVVGAPIRPATGTANLREALFGASEILMQAVIAEKLKSQRPDILLRPPVSGIPVLDFHKAREILEATAAIREETKRAIDSEIQGHRPFMEVYKRSRKSYGFTAASRVPLSELTTRPR